MIGRIADSLRGLTKLQIAAAVLVFCVVPVVGDVLAIALIAYFTRRNCHG